MKRKLLLIGGGGHCRSVLDTAIQLNIYDEIGIVDFTDSSCLGVPVVGNDDDIPSLIREGWNEAFITVGSVGNTGIRRRLYKMVKKLNLAVPSLIDPTAVIANEYLDIVSARQMVEGFNHKFFLIPNWDNH